MPRSKGEAHRIKRKKMQTEIKYNLTCKGAEEDHYVQAPERKNTYHERDNSVR